MNKYTKALEFNDEKHEYKVNGVVLPSVTELCAPLTYSKYRVDNAVIEQAAYRGTLIHELTALYDRGDLEEESAIASDVGMYLQAWINFCHDYQPKWTMIEQQMASSSYAGTIDRVGEIDGTPVIVDIKTTSNMDRASKISLCAQLAGYAFLYYLNSDLLIESEDCMGVQLKKDGTYAVINAKKVEEKYGFESYELFDQLLNMNKLLKGDRRID